MSLYKVTVDVTGTFGQWTLQVQKHVVPLLAEPGGGYHAESDNIDIEADNKLWLFWAAKGKTGEDWQFTINVAPIDSAGNVGAAVSWSDKGTLPAAKQVSINGILDITNMKGAGSAASAAASLVVKKSPAKKSAAVKTLA